MVEISREAIFEKGDQISFNQSSNENLVLKKHVSQIKKYLHSILNIIYYHLLFMTQKPLLYAITYPIQTGIMMGLFASSIIGIYRFFYQTQTSTSDSFSQIESENFVIEETQELATSDQAISNLKAEIEIYRQERDELLSLSEKNTIGRQSYSKDEKTKPYLELGPPIAEALDLKEEAKGIFGDVVDNVVNNLGGLVTKEPVLVVSTEKIQLKQYETMRELNKGIDTAQTSLVTEIHAHSATKVQTATIEAILSGKATCEADTATLIVKLGKECDSKVETVGKEWASKVKVEYDRGMNAEVKLRAECNMAIKAEANNYCDQVQSKIAFAQNVLKGELCDSNPPLCLKELKKILPLPEGNYPEKNYSSVWEKIRNIFKK